MNSHIDRIRDLARQLLQRAACITPAQRVALLIASALVTAIAIGWFQFSGQATEVLLPDATLSSAKRNEMLKAFADAQLSGFSVVDGRIQIPRGQAQKFMAALPDDFQLQDSFSRHREEAARKKSPFESSSEAQIRQRIAIVRDMENLIRKFHGVEDVFIHVDQAVENGLKPKRISTAAVAIVTDGKTRLSRSTIDDIRRIVVSSWVGMKLSDVMVIDVLGGWSIGGPGSDDSQVRSLEYAMQLQAEIEQHWQAKVRDVLAFVPEAQVVVSTPTPTVDPKQPDQFDMQTDRPISISVSVPLSYHQRRRRSSQTSSRVTLQQLQEHTERQIRQSIDGLIKSENAQVVVTTFDDLPADSVVARRGWIAEARERRWAIGAALMIAVGGALIIRLASRSKPKVRADEAASTVSIFDETLDMSESDSQLDQEDSELRATLTDRVQSDPDQAIRVLNQWLSRAG